MDKIIIQRIKQGDKQAFSSLVDRFQKPLFAYLGKMGLPHALAEELAQETFIRAWQAFDKFDPTRAAFITWLFTIARRLAINEYQRAAYRFELSNSDNIATSEQSTSSEKDPQAALYKALDTLSVDDRSLLSLAYIRDFEFSAIAQIEDIPIGTVKSRLYRIRQQLKSTLNGGEHE